MKKFLYSVVLLLGLFSSLICANMLSAQSPASYSHDVENKIKQVEQNLGGWVRIEDHPTWTLQERMSHYKIKGLSIAVVHNYQIEWARAYGWADSAEQRPVTIQTVFQAASISKSLNAVGVLKLVQDKKLDLYADINNYLISWKFPYDSLSKNKKITIINLLSHTAGLSVHGFPGYSKTDTIPTVIEILDGKRPANSPAVRSQFEPGLKFQYSGGGTTISQLIVMDITHQPYDKFMWENVLKPMGMTASFYTQPPPGDRQSSLATAYYADGKEVKGKYHIYPEEAPAGLWTNPTDLCKYIIETQLSYQGKSNKVLSQEFTRLRLTPYVDASAALGVFIDKKGDAKYFEHGGSNEGFRCQYFGSVEGGDGVAVMVNSDNGGILQEVINSVALAYGWKDFYKPATKKVVSLTADQLKGLEGKYQFEFRKGETSFIQITAKDNGIVLKQLWDGQEISFLAESDLAFFSIDFPFTLKFTREANGAATQVLALDRDLWKKVKE
jgi:CubicO group peptidase (beta-lactamase class C family)